MNATLGVILSSLSYKPWPIFFSFATNIHWLWAHEARDWVLLLLLPCVLQWHQPPLFMLRELIRTFFSCSIPVPRFSRLITCGLLSVHRHFWEREQGMLFKNEYTIFCNLINFPSLSCEFLASVKYCSIRLWAQTLRNTSSYACFGHTFL